MAETAAVKESEIEARFTALEEMVGAIQKDVKVLLPLKDDIEMLINVVKAGDGFFRVLRWVAGIIATCAAAWAAIKGINHK